MTGFAEIAAALGEFAEGLGAVKAMTALGREVLVEGGGAEAGRGAVIPVV